MCGFARFVAVGVYEVYDAAQVADIPPTAAFVYKLGKRIVKLAEICFELPLRPRGGILFVRNTAPGTQGTVCVIGALIRIAIFARSVRVVNKRNTEKKGASFYFVCYAKSR